MVRPNDEELERIARSVQLEPGDPLAKKVTGEFKALYGATDRTAWYWWKRIKSMLKRRAKIATER